MIGERPADPCDGARQRIEHIFDDAVVYTDPEHGICIDSYLDLIDRIVAAEIAPLVEALEAADSDMSWMLHRPRERWDENALNATIAKIRAALDRVRTPTDRSESDGE